MRSTRETFENNPVTLQHMNLGSENIQSRLETPGTSNFHASK